MGLGSPEAGRAVASAGMKLRLTLLASLLLAGVVAHGADATDYEIRLTRASKVMRSWKPERAACRVAPTTPAAGPE